MTSPDVNIIFAEEPININLGEEPVEIEMPVGLDGQSLHPRGAWSSSEEYGYLDLVSYQGSSYVATKTVPTGTLPTDTGFWMLSAEKGLDGASEWGDITGDIANQTDLAQALAGKANVGDSYTKAETDSLLADKADADDVYTKDETDALLQNKAPVILNSASGSIASFTDGSTLPVKDLTVAVEPVQDLHGYDNPWPAGGMGNLCNYDDNTEIRGVNCTATIQNYVIKFVPTSNDAYVGNYNDKNYLFAKSPCKTGDELKIVTSDSNFNKNYVTFLNSNGDVVSASRVNNSAFTVPDGAVTMGFRIGREIVSVGTTYSFTVMVVKSTETSTTFTPYSNVCPISGHTSAMVTRTGINIATTVIYKQGYILTSDGSETKNANYIITDKIPVISGNIYTATFIKGNDALRVGMYDEYDNFISRPLVSTSGNAITIPSGVAYLRLSYCTNSGSNAYMYNVQLEKGSTATAYEPYDGTSVTIDLDGTRYGGELNVLTGEMVVTHGITDLGNYNYTYQSNNSRFISTTQVIGMKYTVNDSTPFNGVCSAFPIISANKTTGSSGDSLGVAIAYTDSVLRIRYRDSGITDPSAFKAAMSGVQLVYELASPITVQLTLSQMQTLLGENHIFADTGDVNVTYRADTKLFIEGQIAESETMTRKMIADSATADGKAPKSLATGDLIIVGDELRKATANIGNGSAITASNSTTATLADVIKALQ